MLAYFPLPYENETIYSIVARYSKHTGKSSKYYLFKELFNARVLKMYPEYINNTKILAKNLNHFSDIYTCDYFINMHTSAPLYAPLLKSSTTNYYETVNSFLRDRTIIESEIQNKNHNYYCKDCLKEQIDLYGEGFWNRIFQLPGVFVCVKHKKLLNMHEVNLVKEPFTHFFLPEDSLLKMSNNNTDSKTLQLLLDLADNIEYFFKGNNIDLTKNLYTKYVELIKILEIVPPMSKMKSKLKELLIEKFGKSILDLLNSNPTDNDWISKYFREKGVIKIHPVRHVLLMILLAGSVEKFVMLSPKFAPFGEGPWICMNPLSNHYLERKVKNIDISINELSRNYEAKFKCNCGFTYRLLRYEDPLKVNMFAKRIIKKGEIWEKNFNRLVKNGTSLAELAKKTHLHSMTVRAILKNGPDPLLNSLKKKQKRQSIISSQKVIEYRNIWSNSRESQPTYTRNELRNLNSSIYYWLLKNDNEWISKNLPEDRTGYYKRRSHEYYQKTDLKLLNEFKRHFNQWSIYEEKAGKILRVTKTALCKRNGSLTFLRNNSEGNYPLTTEYISSVYESIEEFQIRKIEHTLNTFFKNKYVKRFELQKKIYLPNKTIKPAVKAFLEVLILNHNEKLSNTKKERSSING